MRITCQDWAALIGAAIVGLALLQCVLAWAVSSAINRAIRDTARHYHGLTTQALARIEQAQARDSLSGLTDLAHSLGESFTRLDHANQTIAGVANRIAAIDHTIRAEAKDA